MSMLQLRVWFKRLSASTQSAFLQSVRRLLMDSLMKVVLSILFVVCSTSRVNVATGRGDAVELCKMEGSIVSKEQKSEDICMVLPSHSSYFTSKKIRKIVKWSKKHFTKDLNKWAHQIGRKLKAHFKTEHHQVVIGKFGHSVLQT